MLILFILYPFSYILFLFFNNCLSICELYWNNGSEMCRYSISTLKFRGFAKKGAKDNIITRIAYSLHFFNLQAFGQEETEPEPERVKDTIAFLLYCVFCIGSSYSIWIEPSQCRTLICIWLHTLYRVYTRSHTNTAWRVCNTGELFAGRRVLYRVRVCEWEWGTPHSREKIIHRCSLPTNSSSSALLAWPSSSLFSSLSHQRPATARNGGALFDSFEFRKQRSVANPRIETPSQWRTVRGQQIIIQSGRRQWLLTMDVVKSNCVPPTHLQFLYKKN